MPKKAANPFPGDYEPELDTTPTLNPKLSSWYASLIGMLRWMVEIGQVDIITEVSKMASQMASPRKGHLDALMHIFGFLRINHNSRMVYDLSYPTIDMNVFKPNDWREVFMEMSRSQPPAMHRNRVERISTYNCTLTVITLGRSACVVRARASSSS
jgi:hypothetical protein